MRGSLAVWCTKADRAKDDVAVDLHFNMWSDLPRRWGRLRRRPADVLDIGIKFKQDRFPAEFYFYFPARITRDFVSDLYDTLRDEKTLSAIFNDTVSFDNTAAAGVTYRTVGSSGRELWIAQLDPSRLVFEPVDDVDSGHVGTVIKIPREVFGAFHEGVDNYIRFRLHLKGDLKWLFASEDIPTDSVFISSFFRTRIVEFRINEKRNYSEALKSRYPDRADVLVEKLHYFLVRHISVELSRSHATFRKMRRLEPRLWTRYLAQFGHVNVENLVIYHWRDGPLDGKEGREEDFIALCAFRELHAYLPVYLVAIVLLGAVGNATQAGLTAFASDRFRVTGWQSQLCLFVSFLGVLFVLFMATRLWGFLRSKSAYEFRSGVASWIAARSGIIRKP